MSGQAFLRGFLGNNNATLTDSQLEKADPPIEVDKYFKKKIGHYVLPSGISTFPFHTYYPHDKDVLDSCSCRKAHENNINSLEKNDTVKDIKMKYESDFKYIVENFYERKFEKFPKYIDLLESIWSAIHQYKEVRLSEKYITILKNF